MKSNTYKKYLALFDLDGTLFDTKDVNYLAYKEAVENFGYSIEYKYFCDFCNGRYYTEFLSKITTSDEKILLEIHNMKKNVYSKYLSHARPNKYLFELIDNIRKNYYTGLVTTASKKNTEEILTEFKVRGCFDLIITREDIEHVKPNPEGFLKAMEHFNITPESTIIFEDSEVGFEAAKRSGAGLFAVKGYN